MNEQDLLGQRVRLTASDGRTFDFVVADFVPYAGETYVVLTDAQGAEEQILITRIETDADNAPVFVVAEEEENQFNFSEYQVSSEKIVLFKNTIKEKFIDKERKHLLTDEYDVIKQLFLAHELFHHLEYTRKDVGITARQRQVMKFAVGRFQWKTGLSILSEIGAHSFAQAMVGDSIIRVNDKRETKMLISGKEDSSHESA